MRTIHIKISRNSLTSRIPGVIPSIVDSWNLPMVYGCSEETEKFYSYQTALQKAYGYNINASELQYETDFIDFDFKKITQFIDGNYGLIPSDVVIPNNIAKTITDYTDFYVNIPDENGGFYDLSWPKNTDDPHYEGRKIISGGTEVKVLTYSTLNKWYVFFNDYFNLIKHPEYSRTYKNALEYYEVEVKSKNDYNKSRYQELDRLFAARGGEKMYNWISNNCIIQYNIPAEFVDEWNVISLYLPEAVKWYWWFKERYDKYEKVYALEDCQDTDDCCDCAEYLRLGGNDFFVGKDKNGGLKAWVEGLDLNSSFATKSASFTVPINITNSIDDLGEMSIFSSDWQAEVDYHNTLEEKGYKIQEDIEFGTIVNNPYKIDEKGNREFLSGTYIIKNGVEHKGYFYNSFFENEFNEEDWIPYTDYFMCNNSELFASNAVKNGNLIEVSAYTFSPLNGKVIYNPTDDDVKDNVKLNVGKVVYINGYIYNVINGKYVELCYDTDAFATLKYKKHIKLPVLKDGSIEYVVFNGNRKYVKVDPNGDERVYFLDSLNCHDDGCKVSKGEYIIYDSCLYLINGDYLFIDEFDYNKIYPVLYGFFNVGPSIFFITKDNKIVYQNGNDYDEDNRTYIYKTAEVNKDVMDFINVNNMILDIQNEIVIVYYKYDVNQCRIISGRSESKLDLLRRKEVTTDDLGNELPGYFRSIVNVDSGENQSHLNVPYDNCLLDILYRTGEVSNLTPNTALTTIERKFFDGNIITNIEFYYADSNNNKKIVVKANEDNALSAIEKCKQEYLDSFDSTILGTMYCEITYHIGAVIEKKDGEYQIPVDEEGRPIYHSGVKYIDTVEIFEDTGIYYTEEGKGFTFRYYSLMQGLKSESVSDFNTYVLMDNSTKFEMMPRLYVYSSNNSSGCELEQLGTDEYYSGWSENNNIMAAPLFRTEYNLASSLPQNVKADIYIDRGISSAFERHLKLEEIRTMEALENIGNNYFKIN